MGESIASKKTLLLLFVISFAIIGMIFLFNKLDTKTTMVICNPSTKLVVYVRVENSFDIVINPYTSQAFIQCLSHHMPFYDREIEVVLFTDVFKDKDIQFLVQRFTIGRIISPQKYTALIPKSPKIRAVQFSKSNFILRVGQKGRLSMFISPNNQHSQKQVETLDYYDGGKSFIVVNRLTDLNIHGSTFNRLLIVAKPPSLTSVLQLSVRKNFTDVVLPKKVTATTLLETTLMRKFSNARVIELKKGEEQSFMWENQRK